MVPRVHRCSTGFPWIMGQCGLRPKWQQLQQPSSISRMINFIWHHSGPQCPSLLVSKYKKGAASFSQMPLSQPQLQSVLTFWCNELNNWIFGATEWHNGSVRALYPAVPGSKLTARKTNPITFFREPAITKLNNGVNAHGKSKNLINSTGSVSGCSTAVRSTPREPKLVRS